MSPSHLQGVGIPPTNWGRGKFGADSGQGAVFQGPFPALGGCSQLGGGWSSPLQQGMARITRGAQGGSLEAIAGPDAFTKRLWLILSSHTP